MSDALDGQAQLRYADKSRIVLILEEIEYFLNLCQTFDGDAWLVVWHNGLQSFDDLAEFFVRYWELIIVLKLRVKGKKNKFSYNYIFLVLIL